MIAETVDIRFECKKCGQHLVVEASAAGTTADCPICSTSVTVPEPEAELKKSEGRVRTAVSAGSPFADPGPEDLREELIDASLLNGRFLHDLSKAREENTRLQQQLKAATEKCEHLSTSATHTQAELKTFQTERQQLKSELSSLRQRLAASEEAISGRDRDLQASLQALQETRAQSGTLERALGTERAERERLAGELGASLEHLQQWQAHSAEQDADLGKTRARLGELEATLLAAKEAASQLAAQRTDLQVKLADATARLVEAGDYQGRLAKTEAELAEQREKLRLAVGANQNLTATGDQLRAEVESLRLNVKETHAGRELLETRSQLQIALAEKERTAAQLGSTESELHALTQTEKALRDELLQTRQRRDEAIAKNEEFSESRVSKDNEVLRGIVARQNAELTQRTAEVFRLKRARSGLKAAYIAFGIGLLAVVALAIKVIPHALR